MRLPRYQSAQAFEEIVTGVLGSVPLSMRYAEFKPRGGALSSKDPDETAFFWHRGAIWLCQIFIIFPSDVASSDEEAIFSTSERILRDRFVKYTWVTHLRDTMLMVTFIVENLSRKT